MMKSDFNNLVFDRKKRKIIPIEMSSNEGESSEPPSYIHTFLREKENSIHSHNLHILVVKLGIDVIVFI